MRLAGKLAVIQAVVVRGLNVGLIAQFESKVKECEETA
jgi:hypothetical protein